MGTGPSDSNRIVLALQRKASVRAQSGIVFDVGKLLAYNKMFVFAPVAQLDRAAVFGAKPINFNDG
jgi:hypothetical protein